jgi:pimeloyl-ACP methyl ester carboxylesterase
VTSARRARRRRAAAELVPLRLAVGDASIHYYDTGAGTPVVMVHGLNHHADAWIRNIAAVAAAGYRVIALDLPGFGRSGMPEMRYTLGGYSDFMVAFLDALGLERVHLAGNSLGGAIVLRTAIDHPGRVLSVAGVDPAGMFERVPKVWSLAASPLARILLRPILGSRRLLDFSHRRSLHDPVHASARQVDLIAEAYQQPGYRDHILRMAESMFTMPEEELLWNGLPGLEMPVVIFWGRQDRTLPLSHAYRAAHRIAHAELIVYDECGHNPMYERADDFNRDYLDFLSRRGGDQA